MLRRLLACACALSLAVPAAAQPAKAPAAAAPAPTAADWRTPDPQNLLVIDTSKGRVIVEILPTLAPAHAARVRELARAGFYDGLRFFRVIDDFMAQTGDPQNNGEGGSTLPDLAAELFFRRGADTPMTVVLNQPTQEAGFLGPVPTVSQSSMLMALTADQKVQAWPLFCPGVAGMARAQDLDTGNSQFFLMRGTNHSLDKRYTAWGRVVAGLDVVRAIKTGEPVAEPQDVMQRARIAADLPAAERPNVRVIDTAGAWFRAEAERRRAQAGEAFSVCDLTIPAEVK